MMNDVEELREVIQKAEEKIIKLHADQWRGYYKNRCGKDFLEYEYFIETFALWNNKGIDNKSEFSRACKIDIYNPCINAILNIGEKYGMNQFGDEIPKMICSACACRGCEFIQEHLGYDCEECKTKLGYQGYQGYCDE